MFSEFIHIFGECMEDVIPKKTVVVGKQRTKPPWYNEECANCKHELNVAKKQFKRRNTPNNLMEIRECEQKFDEKN